MQLSLKLMIEPIGGKCGLAFLQKMDMSSLQKNLIVLQMHQPKNILMVGVGFLIMQITTGIIPLNIQQLKNKKC